jgi:hypothetical protein
MPKYYIFHLVKHTPVLFNSSPEEEAASQRTVNEFFRSWYPRVCQILGAHALGLTADWDWMGVFAVDEVSDWEAFREEYSRRFPGRTERSLSLTGVSHEEFVRATSGVDHYKKLRAMGVFPGGSEIARLTLSTTRSD